MNPINSFRIIHYRASPELFQDEVGIKAQISSIKEIIPSLNDDEVSSHFLNMTSAGNLDDFDVAFTNYIQAVKNALESSSNNYSDDLIYSVYDANKLLRKIVYKDFEPKCPVHNQAIFKSVRFSNTMESIPTRERKKEFKQSCRIARRLIDEGRILQQEGNPGQAIERYSSAIEICSSHSELYKEEAKVHVLRGNAKFEVGDKEGSTIDYESGRKKDRFSLRYLDMRIRTPNATQL